MRILLLFALTLLLIGHGYGQESALKFFNAGDHVDLGPHSNFNIGNEFTVEAWVKFQDSEIQTFVSAFDTANGQFVAGWWLGATDTGRPWWWFANPDSGIDHEVIGISDMRDSDFHHVAATYNNGVIKVYHNGVLEDQSTISPVNFNVSGHVLLGMDNVEFGSTVVLEDIRIWDHERPGSEINEWQNRCIDGTETGLIATYQLQEGSGTTISDLGANNLNGTLVNPDSANWTSGLQCVPDPSSIAENHQETLTVFPNPTSGSFTISWERQLRSGSIEILNSLGKRVHTATVKNRDQIRIPESLQPGHYQIRVIDDSALVRTAKLVVN